MAKLLTVKNEYKLYPKKHVKCGCCHRDFVSEPFIFELRLYSRGKFDFKARCWRCVRSREACELIIKYWPGTFRMVKKGQFYYLEHDDYLAKLFGDEYR